MTVSEITRYFLWCTQLAVCHFICMLEILSGKFKSVECPQKLQQQKKKRREKIVCMACKLFSANSPTMQCVTFIGAENYSCVTLHLLVMMHNDADLKVSEISIYCSL